MSTAESTPGTTAVPTPTAMAPTSEDSTPEPLRSGPSAHGVHHVGGPSDVAADAGLAGAAGDAPGDGPVGAATGASSSRPVLDAMRRQLVDNVILMLLTGVVIAMMSFGFDSLGTRIDDTNTRIDDTNTRIDELSRAVAENGQRLARIEGFLGIGMPEEAAARAPGAALAAESGPMPEGRAQSGGQPDG